MGTIFTKAAAAPMAAGIEGDQVERQGGTRAAVLPLSIMFILFLSRSKSESKWMTGNALVVALSVILMNLVQLRQQKHRPWLRLADGMLTWFGVRAADERCFPLSEVVCVRLSTNGNWAVPGHALCVVTADEVHELVIPPMARPVLPRMRAVLSRHLGDKFIDHGA